MQSVAVLPSRGGWTSSDAKIYETIVTIDEEVEQLKPGMSAVVDIHVDRLKNVLTVPVQAVVQVENDTWCYVDDDGTIERRMIELGRTTNGDLGGLIRVVTGGEFKADGEEGDHAVFGPGFEHANKYQFGISLGIFGKGTHIDG